jgi:hypothetical protein
MEFMTLPLEKRIKTLYTEGDFVMSIRYYGYKVNLFLLGSEFFEVFINHKLSVIENIELLDRNHSRLKFYTDQINLSIPNN